jgi:hypothetical protein
MIEADRAMARGQQLAAARRSRIHRSVNFRDYVWGWALRFGFYWFLAGFFIFMGLLWGVEIWYGQASPLEAKAVMAMALGSALGGVAGSWALWVRAMQFDDLMLELEHEELDFAEEGKGAAEAAQPMRTAAWSMNGGPHEQRIVVRNPKTVEHAGDRFTFTGSQLDRMEIWYDEGHTRVRREASAVGPGWADLPDGGIRSERYGKATTILKGAGLLDDNYTWTAAGENFLREL